MERNALVFPQTEMKPPEIFKICRRCKEYKPAEMFNTHNKTGDKLYPICKLCRRRVVQDSRKVDFFRYVYTRKKAESKARNLNFNLTPDYLESIWTGRCPIFGVELEVFNRYSDNAYALDRIKPDLGYIQGNVFFISRKANWLKKDATEETLLNMIQYMRTHFVPSEVWPVLDVEGKLI